jgi:hypothetical protein
MKKVFFLLSLMAIISITSVNAQNYTTAAGLHIDFGSGGTYVGPSIKHFFTENSAAEAEVVFGNSVVFITALYQYHGDIPDASGLQYYFGAGPSVGFGNSNSAFYIRPVGGLDYKIKDAPIALNFDWRPSIYIGNNGDGFTAARFGLGLRYVIK